MSIEASVSLGTCSGDAAYSLSNSSLPRLCMRSISRRCDRASSRRSFAARASGSSTSRPTLAAASDVTNQVAQEDVVLRFASHDELVEYGAHRRMLAFTPRLDLGDLAREDLDPLLEIHRFFDELRLRRIICQSERADRESQDHQEGHPAITIHPLPPQKIRNTWIRHGTGCRSNASLDEDWDESNEAARPQATARALPKARRRRRQRVVACRWLWPAWSPHRRYEPVARRPAGRSRCRRR